MTPSFYSYIQTYRSFIYRYIKDKVWFSPASFTRGQPAICLSSLFHRLNHFLYSLKVSLSKYYCHILLCKSFQLLHYRSAWTRAWWWHQLPILNNILSFVLQYKRCFPNLRLIFDTFPHPHFKSPKAQSVQPDIWVRAERRTSAVTQLTSFRGTSSISVWTTFM